MNKQMNNLAANQSHFALQLKQLALSLCVDTFEIKHHDLSADYVIKLWCHNDSPLTISDLLNQTALLTLFGESGNCFFHTVVHEIQSLGQTPDGKQFSYFLLLQSPLSLLKLNQNNQVFLNQSVIDIATAILQKAGWLNSQFSFQLSQSYPKRACTIQFNESDYDFLWRILTFWGLFFTWSQQEDHYQLLITDDIHCCDELLSMQSLAYYPMSGTVRPQESIFYLENRQQVLSQNVQLRDYNPAQPSVTLDFVGTPQSNIDIAGFGYEDRYGEHVTSSDDGELLIRVRQQALDWQRNIFIFHSDCPTLQAGQLLELNQCAQQCFNQYYRIIKIEHYGDQSDGNIYSPEKTPRLRGVSSRDGELQEGRNAILPSCCEREFNSREAYKKGNTPCLHGVFYGQENEKIENSELEMIHQWRDHFLGKKNKDNATILDATFDQEKLKGLTYYNKILAIPAGIPYRTYLPMHYKPYQGFMTAIIESADGSPYAYLDDAGSYRVRFPFDLSDAPKGQASHAIRLAQPYSGQQFGIHFPLLSGTEVLLGFENGDIDRPVIMGVISNNENPSPVTADNATQNILRTQSGHTLLMDDTDGQTQLQLATRDLQQQFLLDATDNANVIQLATQQGDMLLQSKKAFTMQTQADYQQTIGNDHHVKVKNQHQVITQQGDIQLQAGRDLSLIANRNIQMQTMKNITLQSGQDIIMNAGQGAAIQSQQGNININTPNGSFNLQAQGVSINSLHGDITIAQAGAMVKIKANGSIKVQAKKINIYAKQHNLVGKQGQMGGQGKAAPSPTPKLPTMLKLIYQYANGKNKKFIDKVSSDVMREDTFACACSPSDIQGQSFLYNLDQGESLTLESATVSDENILLELPIVEINQQKRSPWEKLQIQVPSSPNQGETPDAEHTIPLAAIRPPILKDYSNYANAKSKDLPLLTNDELNYFKQNGNNATIFIHGYNVDVGNFGQQVKSVTQTEMPWISSDSPDNPPVMVPALAATTSLANSTIYCSLHDLAKKFPQANDNIELINGIEPDKFLNGCEAHNWYLHMEYNLNCAAAGQYPFDWQAHGLDYTRMIGIIWPGCLSQFKMISESEYLQAEEPAYKTGLALVQLLQQLHQAGVTIHLIAHSLGARVALTAMQNLAQAGQQNCLEHVFLWQAAVPDNALSPLLPYDPANNLFPQAYQAAKKITVLYSQNDDVLKYAYRLAMGEQVIGQPSNNEELFALGILALRKHQALGSIGPDLNDSEIYKLVTQNKIICVNQGNFLGGHGYMKIPNHALFENIYKKSILSKEKGINKFGNYEIN